MPRETIIERWQRDLGFGQTAQKAFDPNQPRDAEGRWTDTPGGVAPSLVGDLLHPRGTVIAEGPPTGGSAAGTTLRGLPAGIHSGPIGNSSTMTAKDAAEASKAAADVTARFPELTNPKPKGWRGRETYPFWGFEFASDTDDAWGEEVAGEMRLMNATGQIVGAGTSPNLRALPHVKTKTLINDSLDAGDGIHEMRHGEADHSIAEGTRSGTLYGQIVHELGHAVGWAAGVTGKGESQQRDSVWNGLFAKHDLAAYAPTVSDYASQSQTEAFAEMFANYMTDKGMDAGTRKNFEGLLTEILGREVTT